ncbi:unnamed protein product [Arabidopsis lyrata]|uniref:Transmembrane protein n=1 Tax=Arabidopsis lyrata subsp. lyrata TaxID=81972 RepID=D7KFK7_ARALL|nr:uncharacterized protein LOC9329691 [Arabidopsis lyrata subsp. lyrata]EFH69889.1 hypothetical protein ARALYDRAFT_473282 [Arabidopsis lyrata subsp. lyrata]CAH8253991.1 unnamed protein product [Arabidopsis lyrata]|eukprot:XP_020869351.1 uncharacterized protein LOC9329691 [Arabidopsis lyrata subsp. lyrata]
MAAHKTSEFPPLISMMIVFIVLESTSINARELRPSDHGLEYYYEPGESSEMTSFFGPPSSNELTSSSSPSSSILPSAVKSPMKKMSSSKDQDDDHVMNHVLVVGSLVCGVSGVALMVASALIYFLGYPKTQNSSVNCDHIHNNVNNTK